MISRRENAPPMGRSDRTGSVRDLIRGIMSEKDDLEFWVKLSNDRGIAGAAAQTNKTKPIVEESYINEFVNAVHLLSSIEIYDLKVEEPPSPDFSTHTSGKKLAVELTEFIDSKVVNEAKKIKKDPNNPLNDFNVSGAYGSKQIKTGFILFYWKQSLKRKKDTKTAKSKLMFC